MQEEKKAKPVGRTITYFIIIAIVALIQNTDGLTIEIAGARCFLIIPTCIILAMGEDEIFGAVLGLWGGLIWDMVSPAHYGFNAVFLTVACFFSAMMTAYILRNTFLTNALFSVLSIFLYCVLYWLFFIIIKGVDGAELTIATFYVPCGVYTTVTMPIIWLCLRPVKRRFSTEIHLEKIET